MKSAEKMSSNMNSAEIEHIERVLKNIISNSSRIVRIAESGLDNISSLSGDGIDYLISKNYAELVITHGIVYDDFSELFGLIHREDKLQHVELEKIRLPCRVDVKATKDSLYVKLPRVPVKYFRRSDLFQEELWELFTPMLDKGEIPFIHPKAIYIVNTFSNDFNANLIPDNDNYDIKRILDIITDYCSCGDSGPSTDLIYKTFITDDVPMGTYFIVKPMSDRVDAFSEILNELKIIFERK